MSSTEHSTLSICTQIRYGKCLELSLVVCLTIVRNYYIGLGSNLGDRYSNIMSALQALRRYVEVLKVSSLYETAPVRVEGPNFLNATAQVACELSVADLQVCLERVETRLGRSLSHDAAARPIDVELLDLGGELVREPFYLVPLNEIAPDLMLGGEGPTVSELARGISVLPNRRSRAVRFEADRQSGVPDIPLSVDLVGVSRIKRTVSLLIDGREREIAAEFSMEADLAQDRAGVHMSRFSERLEGAMLEAFAQDLRRADIATFLQTIANDVKKSQHARAAQVTMRAPFTLERWTPVSGRRGEETYSLNAAAYASDSGVRVWIGVEVEGMTACPCAQMMMREQGRRELLEAGFSEADSDRALDALPAPTHNQRGRGRIVIGLPSGHAPHIYLEDLVEIVEASMSSETYELLKRPDEFFIVNKAHRNPRFVEDVVRGILARGLEQYRDLAGEAYLEASQINDESIHKHDAIALAHGTFAELRAELSTGTRAAARTGLTTWLRGASS
jgi:GTP cyclohydrolase-4